MATDAGSKYTKPPRAEALPFTAWLDSQNASAFSNFEIEVLSDEARRFHGEVMLWLGPSVRIAKASSKRCMIWARLYGAVSTAAKGSATRDSVVVSGERLPFPAHSIDGLVLHHSLELGGDARAILRETQRVLRPGGRVAICGFNSLSIWGLPRWRAAFRGLVPYSSVRLQDWVSVLGIHRDRPVRYLNYYGRMVRSVKNTTFLRIAKKLRRIPFLLGDIDVICGVKQKDAQIPPRKAVFSRLSKVHSIGLPKPVARQ